MAGVAGGLPVLQAKDFDVIRLLVRLLALASLAGAFAACVIDGARSIAADHFSATQIGETAYWANPGKFQQFQDYIEHHTHPLLWPILLHVLMLPTFAFLGIVGAGLLYVARKRPPPIGHSNRSR